MPWEARPSKPNNLIEKNEKLRIIDGITQLGLIGHQLEHGANQTSGRRRIHGSDHPVNVTARAEAIARVF